MWNAAQLTVAADGRLQHLDACVRRPAVPELRSGLRSRAILALGLAPAAEPQPRWAERERQVKVRDIIRRLEADGWSQVRQRGSHRQFKHPTKPGLVTVAGQAGHDLAPGTLNSVLKQAGLKE